MNNNFGQNTQNGTMEFLSWVPTPGEKHLGIATMRLERRFIFRFKVAPSSNGAGLWATKAAYKVGVKPDGKDNYDDSFEFDSDYEKKQIEGFVKDNVQAFLSRANPNAQASAFAQPQAQAQPSYYQQPPQPNYSQPPAYGAPQYANNVPNYANSPMPEMPASTYDEAPLPF